MATSEKQDSTNTNTNVENLIAQAQASMTPQERETTEYLRKQDEILKVLYLKKIRDVALDGFKNGFTIDILFPREIEEGNLDIGPLEEKNILTGKMERNESMEWKPRPFKKQALTTKDYNDYVQYRHKWIQEQNFGNPAVAEDMEDRLYEFAAKKYLGIDHNTYTRANKEQLRLVVDACVQINAWNGQFITRDEFETAKLDEVAEESETTTMQQPKLKVRDPTGQYSIKIGDELNNTDD